MPRFPYGGGGGRGRGINRPTDAFIAFNRLSISVELQFSARRAKGVRERGRERGRDEKRGCAAIPVIRAANRACLFVRNAANVIPFHHVNQRSKRVFCVSLQADARSYEKARVKSAKLNQMRG